MLDVAKNVIDIEINGLKELHAVLDDTFIDAVNCIHNLKGRLIVSGMGKSGHIARKIAATMASTGTPALFVHPAEASHGDLGMVTKDDAMLLLSNSGETKELGDMIHYAKRFNIPLLSMVRREESFLVEASDIAFILPAVEEASPVNAPTTSTTMMLAFGDCLAMALLEKQGFSNDDFANFHPGGKLGSQFIKVADIMHTGDALPIVNEQDSMAEALIVMTQKSLGCALVVSDNKLIGLITDGDLRRHMDSTLIKQVVATIMTPDPSTIEPDKLAAQALAIMNTHNITSLPVANKEGLQGVIHIHDILRAGV